MKNLFLHIVFVLFGVIILIGIEVVLRSNKQVRRYYAGYARKFFGPLRLPSPKVLSFESHPYALYVKKPGSDGLYPSNSMGYGGKREIAKAKTPSLVRIYCVGGSTMETHDPDLGPDSSWPGRLQDILGARFRGVSIECINAGTAGYTSAESLSEFLFRGIDIQPDMLLIYHNVNDAWTCQMVADFKSDYSHARRHKSWNVGWVNRIPQLPYLWSYQILRDRITKRYGKANTLLHWVSDPPWPTVVAFHPDRVYAFRRNISNLVAVAQAWACTPVLIKWECDWGVRRMPGNLERTEEAITAYFHYLEANNRALKEIAATFVNCHYIEVGPFEPRYFKDTIHFTTDGLEEMARRVADRIEPIVRSVLKAKKSDLQRAII